MTQCVHILLSMYVCPCGWVKWRSILSPRYYATHLHFLPRLLFEIVRFSSKCSRTRDSSYYFILIICCDSSRRLIIEPGKHSQVGDIGYSFMQDDRAGEWDLTSFSNLSTQRTREGFEISSGGFSGEGSANCEGHRTMLVSICGIGVSGGIRGDKLNANGIEGARWSLVLVERIQEEPGDWNICIEDQAWHIMEVFASVGREDFESWLGRTEGRWVDGDLISIFDYGWVWMMAPVA